VLPEREQGLTHSTDACLSETRVDPKIIWTDSLAQPQTTAIYSTPRTLGLTGKVRITTITTSSTTESTNQVRPPELVPKRQWHDMERYFQGIQPTALLHVAEQLNHSQLLHQQPLVPARVAPTRTRINATKRHILSNKR
jgi:predicted transcriptional regulator